MTWVRTYFELSSGLSKEIIIPVGTCEAIKSHFEKVTKELGLKVEQCGNNPPRWNTSVPPSHISDYTAATTVFSHNRFVRELYNNLGKWSEEPPDGETELLTPEFAKSIWYGFSMLRLEYHRWTEEVYIEEMQTLFEAMRDGESGGILFEGILTADQAAAVISLFSTYFDKDDVRLALPNNRDWLETSDDYYICPSHGVWHYEDVMSDYDDETGEGGDNLICPVDGCGEVIG